MSTGTAKQVASLVAQAQRQESLHLASCEKRYVELIHRNTGTAADVRELLACAQTLGKSSTEINADRLLIEEHEADIADMNNRRGATSVANRLEAIRRVEGPIVEAAINRLTEQRNRLRHIGDAAREVEGGFTAVRQRAEERRAKHPQLLGAIELPHSDILLDEGVAIDAIVPKFGAWAAGRVDVRSAPLSPDGNAPEQPTPNENTNAALPALDPAPAT